MYPAVPYNASSIYEIYKMKWNRIKYSLQSTTLFSNNPYILLGNTKQSIARQFPMLDSYVMVQVSAEIWW